MYLLDPLRALVTISSISIPVFATYSFDPADYDPSDVLNRDVAIVGGGSTGVYSAVRLQDNNKTVIVIEKNDYLGGHAETYYHPTNHFPFNLGVIVFHNITVVRNYFSRFSVPLTKLTSFGSGATEYVDFSTGKSVDVTAPSTNDTVAAFASYATQLQRYPSVQGSFNLSYPIPDDSELLLPFGSFLKKYNLSAIVPPVFISNQGYAPLLNISTLYMLKYLNAHQLQSISTGYLVTTHHDTGELYANIKSYLGSNAILSTSILSMSRSPTPGGGVKLVLSTPTGKKLVLAKALLSTPPPLTTSLKTTTYLPTKRPYSPSSSATATTPASSTTQA